MLPAFFLCDLKTEHHEAVKFQVPCLTPKSFWVNYNELTTSSLEIMVSKGNHPQMALIQISELL